MLAVTNNLTSFIQGHINKQEELKQTALNKRFYSAIDNNNVDQLRTLSKTDLKIQPRKGDIASPLMIAVRNGNKEIVELLIDDFKVDINFQLKEGKCKGATALHIAIVNECEEIVGFLIKKGADIELAEKSGETPLHFALCSGKENIVSLLLAAGANVWSYDKLGHNSLCHAIDSRETKMIKQLFEHIENPRDILELLNQKDFGFSAIDHSQNTRYCSSITNYLKEQKREYEKLTESSDKKIQS